MLDQAAAPMIRFVAVAMLIAGCSQGAADSKRAAASELTISNMRDAGTDVYISFGADSQITAADWSFCPGNGLTCKFSLTEMDSKSMPNPKGKYINATIAFGAPVGCGSTKAEININNPKWYDTLDVSLVDGYSNRIQIVMASTTLGPPAGKTGNQGVTGVFPYGCDICVARQSPPCGISKGKTGCKAGTQYDPKPPCQWQGPSKGGGSGVVNVTLLP